MLCDGKMSGDSTTLYVRRLCGSATLDHAAECENIRGLISADAAPTPGVEGCEQPQAIPGRGLQCYNLFRLREAFKLWAASSHADELTAHVFGSLAVGTKHVIVSRDAFLNVYQALLRYHYSSQETLLHFCVAVA